MKFSLILLIIFLQSCSSNPKPLLKTESGLKYTIAQGISAPQYHLDQNSDWHGLYLLGPAAHFNGEVTVLDGELHHSKVTTEGIIRTNHEKDKELVFAVHTNCLEFEILQIDKALANLEEIEEYLDSSLPRVYNWRGTAENLIAHIVTAPNPSGRMPLKKSFDLSGRELNFVAFYSRNHRRIFTHHDSNIHIHVIDENGHTYHLDEIQNLKTDHFRFCNLRTN